MHAAASTAARIEEAIAIPLRTVARRRGASTFLISLRTSARIGAISGRSRPTAVATRPPTSPGIYTYSRSSVPTKAFTIGPPGRVITPTIALSTNGIMAAGSVHPPTGKPAPGIANITVVAAVLLVGSLHISSHVCHCCRLDRGSSRHLPVRQIHSLRRRMAHPARPGHVSRFFRAVRTGRLLAAVAVLSFDGRHVLSMVMAGAVVNAIAVTCVIWILRRLAPAPAHRLTALAGGFLTAMWFGAPSESFGTSRRPSVSI